MPSYNLLLYNQCEMLLERSDSLLRVIQAHKIATIYSDCSDESGVLK